MNTMTTLSEVLNKLKAEGYNVDFNLKSNCLVCNGNSLEIHPEDFVVDRHYRFEGYTDPADEAIVYAISSKVHGLKGVLVNGYGLSSDAMTDKMIAALSSGPVANDEADEAGSSIFQMDLDASRQKIMQEASWTAGERASIVLFKSDKLRIVMMALRAGAELKTHTAPGPIAVQVLEGQMKFATGAESVDLSAGKMVTLDAGIPHSVSAARDSVFVLTISLS